MSSECFPPAFIPYQDHFCDLRGKGPEVLICFRLNTITWRRECLIDLYIKTKSNLSPMMLVWIMLLEDIRTICMYFFIQRHLSRSH